MATLGLQKYTLKFFTAASVDIYRHTAFKFHAGFALSGFTHAGFMVTMTTD